MEPKILIADTEKLMQLDENGQIDNSFTAIPVSGDLPPEIELLYDVDPGGEVIVCNYPQPEFGIVKFDASGINVMDFKPEIAAYGAILACDTVHDQFMIGGNFVRLGAHKSYHLARINANGSVDPSFKTTSQFRQVRDIDVLDDQNILVSARGSFFKINGLGEQLFSITMPSLREVGKFRGAKGWENSLRRWQRLISSQCRWKQ